MLNLCLPVIEASKRSVTARIKDCDPGYTHFEIWLDYVEDLDARFLKKLCQDYGPKLILLLRRQDLEPTRMPYEKRQEVFKILDGSECMLDLDVRTQSDELDYIRDERLDINIVTSYHNYNLTPPLGDLSSIIDEMDTYRPVIFKVSTLCRDRNDALILMTLLLKLDSDGKQYVVSGMGDHGKILRLVGALWGNQLTFAPESAERASAPGQIVLRQLQNILRELK